MIGRSASSIAAQSGSSTGSSIGRPSGSTGVIAATHGSSAISCTIDAPLVVGVGEHRDRRLQPGRVGRAVLADVAAVRGVDLVRQLGLQRRHGQRERGRDDEVDVDTLAIHVVEATLGVEVVHAGAGWGLEHGRDGTLERRLLARPRRRRLRAPSSAAAGDCTGTARCSGGGRRR